MLRIVAAVCFLLAQFVIPSLGHAATPAAVESVVDSVAEPLMKKEGIPGMAIGVVAEGRPYVLTFGVMSLATRKPVTNHTLFELGSVSKTLTATLVAYAERTGHLSLADPVRRFLPVLDGTAFGNVTLLELGTYTPGGLPLQVPSDIRTSAELMDYFKAWRPSCAAGTCRTYSNVSLGALGLVAAESEGEPFTDFMEQQLLPMLGMRDTWYTVPAASMPDYAEGYTKKQTPIRMAPGVLSAETYGVRTTVDDMLRFLQANMDLIKIDGTVQAAITATHTGYFKAGPMTQGLVWEQYPWPASPQTLQEGNSPRMIFDATPVTRITPPRKPSGDVWINKTGSTNGFGAYVAFVPAQRSGIVILANKNFPIKDRVEAAYEILTRITAAR